MFTFWHAILVLPAWPVQSRHSWNPNLPLQSHESLAGWWCWPDSDTTKHMTDISTCEQDWRVGSIAEYLCVQEVNHRAIPVTDIRNRYSMHLVSHTHCLIIDCKTLSRKGYNNITDWKIGIRSSSNGRGNGKSNVKQSVVMWLGVSRVLTGSKDRDIQGEEGRMDCLSSQSSRTS